MRKMELRARRGVCVFGRSQPFWGGELWVVIMAIIASRSARSEKLTMRLRSRGLHRHRPGHRPDEVQEPPRGHELAQGLPSGLVDHGDWAGRQARVQDTARASKPVTGSARKPGGRSWRWRRSTG